MEMLSQYLDRTTWSRGEVVSLRMEGSLGMMKGREEERGGRVQYNGVKTKGENGLSIEPTRQGIK